MADTGNFRGRFYLVLFSPLCYCFCCTGRGCRVFSLYNFFSVNFSLSKGQFSFSVHHASAAAVADVVAMFSVQMSFFYFYFLFFILFFVLNRTQALRQSLMWWLCSLCKCHSFLFLFSFFLNRTQALRQSVMGWFCFFWSFLASRRAGMYVCLWSICVSVVYICVCLRYIYVCLWYVYVCVCVLL